MPQPLERMNPNASFILSTNAPKKYPHLAAQTCSIIAGWAWIEKELELLLIRTLRADDTPAIAMYSVLTSQSIQSLALDAAAKSVLNKEKYEIFSAVIGVVDAVHKERNKFAHWLWAESPELPDTLILVDPKTVVKRDVEALQILRPKVGLTIFSDDFMDAFLPDKSGAYVYTADDLDRIGRDMTEAAKALTYYAQYINPTVPARLAQMKLAPEPSQTPEEIADEALHQLSTLRLFRESLDRVREGQKSNPQPRP
jgi:hypothetical protein